MKNHSAEEAEISGLDMPEMGAMAYPDFLEAQGPVFYPVDGAAAISLDVTASTLREEVGS